MREAAQRLFTPRTAAIALVLVAAFIGLLVLEGRPAWCKSGFGIWVAAWTSCTSQHLFDPYSLTHVLHGILFYWLLRPFAGKLPLHWLMLAAIGLEIAWELLENSPWVIERYRQDTAALHYTGDSTLNAFGDLVSTIIGFAFAARVSWKWSLAVFIGFELWMLYLARDNFTLNVLMLFWPVDAIREWQLSGIRPLG